MQLPNKLYSYKSSTLALVPVVLRALQNGRPAEVKDPVSDAAGIHNAAHKNV